MNKRDLDTLLKKVLQGDNDAFARLYAETAKGVLAFAYSYLRNYADAEDVTEDVFLQIKRKISLYRPGTDARAWIFQITKNLARDELRRRKRRGETLEEIPASKIAVQPKLSSLDSMIDILDESEREIVLLHAVWGYKHREIAQMTGLPPGTVMWKYNAAIKKLREEKEEE